MKEKLFQVHVVERIDSQEIAVREDVVVEEKQQEPEQEKTQE